MTKFRSISGAIALAGLCACSPAQPDLAALRAPEVSRLSQVPPPGAEPGTCWGKTVTPAIIETVTDQILLAPARVAGDGAALRPATYRTETRQNIVSERRDIWFQTPCEAVQTREFIASLQRALNVRGLYHGPVTGEMDSRTRAAVRRYQKPDGLDTGILAIATARDFGLVAVEPDPSG